MTTSTPPGALLEAILGILREVAQERLAPAEARQRFMHLRNERPELDLELLWQQEIGDGSIHYDAVLRLSGEATVTLGYACDSGLPWILRGLHRWNDGDLGRVNGRRLTVATAVEALGLDAIDTSPAQRLIDGCLLDEAFERHGIEVPALELKEALTRFRKARGLMTRKQTEAWLAERRITQGALEDHLRRELGRPKLTARIAVDGTVGVSCFDTAWLQRVSMLDEQQALVAYAAVDGGKLTMEALAEREFLSATGPTPAFHWRVHRSELPAEDAHLLFSAAPGSLLRLSHGPRVDIVRMLRIERAPEGEAALDGWLAEQRRSAHIEWYWGAHRIPSGASK